MEEQVLIPPLLLFLNQIDRTTDGLNIDVRFASTALEAQADIGNADIAIINIDDEGRAIAEIALNVMRIPVIALSRHPQDLASFREHLSFRFVPKENFNLAKFLQNMRDLINLVLNKKTKQRQANFARRDLNRAVLSQVPTRN
jgi:hypothetical protein